MKTISRKLIRRDPAGYEVWRETSLMEYDVQVIDDAGDPEGAQEFVLELDDQSDRLVTLDCCYSPEGGYIGSEEDAEFLCKTLGIKPEVIPGNEVCSIGFCEHEQKWYGWSHHTIYGFGIGDVAKEGDYVCSNVWTDEYLAEHPDEDLRLPAGFEAKTLEDAKRMAIAFADSAGIDHIEIIPWELEQGQLGIKIKWSRGGYTAMKVPVPLSIRERLNADGAGSQTRHSD